MEQAYKKIVEQIFGNWTGLQLAVEHSMGGPNSKQIAIDTVDYIVNYLTSEPDIEIEDIEDVLEDIMDQEFNTICEDNSVKEVSQLLFKFLQLLRQGNTEQCEAEYNNLPVAKQWLSQCQSAPIEVETSTAQQVDESVGETSMNTDAPMEEVDPEWTQVKTRRKR